AAACGMSGAVWGLKGFLLAGGLGDAPVLFLCLAFGVAAYLLLMLIGGGFDEQDREKFKTLLRFRLT
ncbi:MAG: hypothetical protein MJA84_02165, partial [Firmicutes bacterium]|nr:hypothetical protein [Bacillota bacterium]